MLDQAISQASDSPDYAPESGGGTQVLERPQEKRNDGDQDRFAHYVRSDRAKQAAITGKPVVALCGKVWVPTRDASKFPVCPRCKQLHADLMKGNWPL